MNKLLSTISNQNRQAAGSTLTSGELYLASLNADLQAAVQSDEVAFSCGAGACQVRSFGKGRQS